MYPRLVLMAKQWLQRFTHSNIHKHHKQLMHLHTTQQQQIILLQIILS